MTNIPQIPYFETSRYRVATMVELSKAKNGDLPVGKQEKCADLGAGDGRITIAFAKAGIETHGFEIDPERKKQAEENIKKAGLTNAFIHEKDFWSENLSQYNIVCCYPMPQIMGRLQRKLRDELKPGSRILLNYFPFVGWKEKKIKDNIYLYIT